MLSLLLIIGGFLSESATIYFLFKYNIDSLGLAFFYLVLLHTAGVILFSFGINSAGKSFRIGNPKNWLIICLVYTFIFPAVGMICLAIAFVFLTRHAWKKTDVLKDYEKYITYDYKPEEKHIEPDKLTESISDELEIRPLVDVMRDQDINLRRGAIHVMERLPKKDAVRLLKQTLQDRNIEIKFHAILALSKIEGDLNKNIMMAQEEVERDTSSPETHLSLANSYAEYYESGILDDATARTYAELAIGEYYKTIELGKEDIKILNSLANLEIHTKKYDNALSKFEKVCQINPHDVYANVGIIQVLFETGKVKEAIERSKQIIDKMPKTRGPMREIIEYWSSQENE